MVVHAKGKFATIHHSYIGNCSGQYAILCSAITCNIICLLTGVGVTPVSLKGPFPAELLADTRRKHAMSPAGIAIMLIVTGTIIEMC